MLRKLFSYLGSFPAVLGLAALGFAFLALPFAGGARAGTDGKQAPPAAGMSHVRVVRLSFLQGTAAIRRPDSDKWTEAMVNTPIQQGFILATDKGSFLEVEFENGSTVRLGERSELDFTQLALANDGSHVNHLLLEDGYATFNVVGKGRDEYVVSVAGVNVTPQGKTEFRADLDQEHMRVEVFGGRVVAGDSSHTETMGKNHALTREAGTAAALQVSDGIKKDDWDKWTDARAQQSLLAYNEEAVNPASPLYGWDDLDVYGEWGFFPGYGNAWIPYEPVGWSPYASGLWDFYPGMGYTWVSGEPWGWLPFHYGFWNYDASMGWFWMPGQASWSPALVNWYSGPGWIGWTPIGSAGVGGRLPCTLAVVGCLTAVAPGVVSSGQLVKPGSPSLVHPTAVETFTQIAAPNVAPSQGPLVHAMPAFVAASVAKAAGGVTAAPQSTASASGFARGSGSAPSSVIMGRQMTAATFVGRRSGGDAAVHVRLGRTMGGNSAGVGGLRVAQQGQASSGPRIMARASSGGGFATGGGVPRGGGFSAASSSGSGGASHAAAAASSGSSGSVAHH